MTKTLKINFLHVETSIEAFLNSTFFIILHFLAAGIAKAALGETFCLHILPIISKLCLTFNLP